VLKHRRGKSRAASQQEQKMPGRGFTAPTRDRSVVPNPANLNAAFAAERARALLRRESERDGAIRNQWHDMRDALNRALSAAILFGLSLVAASLLHFGLPATPSSSNGALILAVLAAATALYAAFSLARAGFHLFKWFALRRA
jgi:hypothetical protein